MQLPFFYEEAVPDLPEFTLSEESSKHIVQVLRIEENENFLITNGEGALHTARLLRADRKKAVVKIINREFIPEPIPKICIGAALLKNKSRYEWFLEKSVEIGVSEIFPVISDRTEKQRVKDGRIKNILVSAMLQSQQAWLPVLHEPMHLSEIVTNSTFKNRYIAHCLPEVSRQGIEELSILAGNHLLLIGPEGDFTKREIEMALRHNFIPVSLGKNRLRTETAAIVAAVLLLKKLNRL
jgi:16S rRNA (uracil1498-N3)-methyltransferase